MPTPKRAPTAAPEQSASEKDKPLRADARRNRARVLEVAEEMFSTEGMAVPIDAIAERAGLGVGTVYRHFPTKDALFAAIMVRRIEAVTDRARVLAEADDPGAAFYEFFTGLAEQSERSRGLHDAIVAAGFQVGPVLSEFGQRMMTALEVLLRRAQAAGAVRADVTAVDVKAMMTGMTAVRMQGGDPQRTLAVVLAGLRPERG